MKREKLVSALWAFLLSFAISAATTMCIVTAFGIGIDTGLLIRTCVLTALICSFCYSLPLSLVPLGGGAAILGYLWQKGTLAASAEALLNRLTRLYDRAYGWGVIRWGFRTADEMEPDIVFMLCILGAVIAMLTAWAICRKKTVIPALGLSFLAFSTCFVVNDTVPEIPWLYLLILGFILLMMTGRVRRQDEKQGNRLCLLLTPVAALALLILFAAIPKEGYSGQDTAKKFTDSIMNSDSMQLLLGHMDGGGAIGGTTDANAVDLRSVGYRVETHAQVLQVTAPYTGTVYLRGRALDTFDGVRWGRSDIRYDTLYWPSHQLQSVGEMTIATRFAHRMLYMPYYAKISNMQDVSMGIVNEENLTEYSFTCLRSDDPSVWSTAQTSDALEQYISMDETVRQWAQPLVKKLTKDSVSTRQKAQNIASYVRNCATYNTRTPRMPATEKNFARWFLDNSDTGYCVHFATAATVLLQAAGIPARYVTGYYAQVVENETVTVYSDQAHAWAEYWLPGFGWTVLEATPPDFSADPQETTESTVSVMAPENPTDTVPHDTATVPTDVPAPEPQRNRDIVLWLLLGTAAVCLLVTAAEGQRSLRRRLRKSKLDTAEPNEKALLYWQETVMYARLLNESPDSALFALAQKAKFSQHTLTETQLQQFEDYIQSAAAKLHRHNIFRRFYYRFVLVIY